jgi:hypothetical protein
MAVLLEQHGYYDQSRLLPVFAYFLQQPPIKVAMRLLQGGTIRFTRIALLCFKVFGTNCPL